MRIGIYVAQVGVLPGFENMASAHVQIPLHAAGLLAQAGHQVSLITTRLDVGRVRPACYPAATSLHEIRDASRQGARRISDVGRITGFRAGAAAAALLELSRIARQQRLDVVHFFGGAGTINLAVAFRLIAPCRVVATFNVGLIPRRRLVTRMWRRLDALITSTEYVQEQLIARGLQASVIRHGEVRGLCGEGMPNVPRDRRRVLFWREATWRNGGDLAVAVYKELAPRYPEVSFEFALRPHWKTAPGLADLPKQFPNVRVHQAPYPHGITLDSLLADSLCVLQPFREFTIQPQLSILETMLAGVPVIACDVQSIAELIEDGRNGVIVPPDDASALARAVDAMLRAPDRARELGIAARADASRRWNWDDYVASVEALYRGGSSSHA